MSLGRSAIENQVRRNPVGSDESATGNSSQSPVQAHWHVYTGNIKDPTGQSTYCAKLPSDAHRA